MILSVGLGLGLSVVAALTGLVAGKITVSLRHQREARLELAKSIDVHARAAADLAQGGILVALDERVTALELERKRRLAERADQARWTAAKAALDRPRRPQ